MSATRTIEHLAYNKSTLPPSINKYFERLGIWAGFKISEKGIDHNFFVLDRDFKLFLSRLKQGKTKNKKGVKLDEKTIHEFLISYGKGFNDGYNTLINSISESELFSDSDNDKAYRIFARVYDLGFHGSINVFMIDIKKKEMPEYITTESLYKAGVEGGELYKSLEVILKSPKTFEPFFDEQEKKKKDKSATKTNLSAIGKPNKPLVLPEIALLVILKGDIVITRKNQQQIAKDYGFTGKGTGLYGIYTDLSIKNNRVGMDYYKRAGEDKLKTYYKRVIPLIEDGQRKKEAEAELLILEGFNNKKQSKK